MKRMILTALPMVALSVWMAGCKSPEPSQPLPDARALHQEIRELKAEVDALRQEQARQTTAKARQLEAPPEVLQPDGSLLLTLPASSEGRGAPAAQTGSSSATTSQSTSQSDRARGAVQGSDASRSQTGPSTDQLGALRVEDYGNRTTGGLVGGGFPGGNVSTAGYPAGGMPGNNPASGNPGIPGDLSSISPEDYQKLMEQLQKGNEYLEERNKLIEQLNNDN